MKNYKSENFDTVILVLLYNKEINNSLTLYTISKLDGFNDKTLIIIWNNGPVMISEDDIYSMKLLSKGVHVVYEHTINNISLAKIYNKVLEEYNSNLYVLLDHDTKINEDYLRAIIKPENEILLPIIKMNEKIYYPKINRIPVQKNQKIGDKDFVISIGSGLVLSKKIINKIKQKYGSVFDERFYLYGVDSTFFYRIKKLNLNSSIKIINTIEHSLSKYQVESENITIFRKIERSYDSGLKYRFYYKYTGVFYFIRNVIVYLVKSLFGMKQSIVLYHFINAYFYGRHHRG